MNEIEARLRNPRMWLTVASGLWLVNCGCSQCGGFFDVAERDEQRENRPKTPTHKIF